MYLARVRRLDPSWVYLACRLDPSWVYQAVAARSFVRAGKPRTLQTSRPSDFQAFANSRTRFDACARRSPEKVPLAGRFPGKVRQSAIARPLACASLDRSPARPRRPFLSKVDLACRPFLSEVDLAAFDRRPFLSKVDLACRPFLSEVDLTAFDRRPFLSKVDLACRPFLSEVDLATLDRRPFLKKVDLARRPFPQRVDLAAFARSLVRAGGGVAAWAG